MTNHTTAFDNRTKQMSLPFMTNPSFEYPKGSLRRHESVEEAVQLTLSSCPLSREEIADEMSRLLIEDVTKNHLQNWAAESKNGWRMPLEWAAAFCIVTNDTRVIKAALRGSGINILDDNEMVYYEIGKAEEEKREITAKLKNQRNKVKELKMQGKVG